MFAHPRLNRVRIANSTMTASNQPMSRPHPFQPLCKVHMFHLPSRVMLMPQSVDASTHRSMSCGEPLGTKFCGTGSDDRTLNHHFKSEITKGGGCQELKCDGNVKMKELRLQRNKQPLGMANVMCDRVPFMLMASFKEMHPPKRDVTECLRACANTSYASHLAKKWYMGSVVPPLKA